MARARKAAESEQDGQSEQKRREAAREAAGQANQDQEHAPDVEQMPQQVTTSFIAQPDVLKEPEGTPADDSSDKRDEGHTGE